MMSGDTQSWRRAAPIALWIAAAAVAAWSLRAGAGAASADTLSTPTWLWLVLAALAVVCRLVRPVDPAPEPLRGRFSPRTLVLAGLLFTALLAAIYAPVLAAMPSDTDEWLILKCLWDLSTGGSLDWAAQGSGIHWLRVGGLLPQLALTQITGLSPLALRVLALLMHAGSGVLVLALGRRVGLSTAGALAAALLFLLYAPNHEAITLISATPFTQATLLLLAGLVLLERGVDPDAPRPRLRLAAGLLCGLLAGLSKEVALVFPLLVAGLGLAADREGAVAALRRRRWALLGAAGVAALVLVALLAAPLDATVDAAGHAIDQRAVLAESLGLGALWTSFVDVLPRALAVPFSAHVLPEISGPLAGLLLAGMALLLGAVGVAARPSLRALAGLALLVAAGFAPTFFEAAPHYAYLEDTRYFVLPSVGAALLLAAALELGLSRGRRWPLAAGAVVLVGASLAAMPGTLGLRVVFADRVAQVSGVLGRELARRDATHELYLVSALHTVDRSGVEAALLAQVVDAPARARVHLLSELRFRERLAPGVRPAVRGPVVRIRPGPQTALLGWPPGRAAGFGPLDAAALWQLVSSEAAELAPVCPACQTILIDFDGDVWVFEGELRRDVTYQSVVERA